MIAQLSSFVEFFSAVYVTMSLDNTFCKDFWTPDYNKDIERIFNKYPFKDSLIYKNLLDSTVSIAVRVQNSSRKKGGFMLAFCIFLLIYIGLENPQIADSLYYRLPLSYICGIVFIFIIFFQKFLFRKWKNVFLLIVLLAFAFWMLDSCYSLSSDAEIISRADKFSIRGIKFEISLANLDQYILIATLIFPILHQLFSNWIYSRIYKKYLETGLAEEYKLYSESKDGIEQHDKSMVAKVYLTAFNDSYFNNGDRNVTSLNNVLYERLLKITSPSIYKLIYSYTLFQFCYLYNRLFSHSKESTNGNESEQLPGTAEIDYEKQYTNLLQFQRETKKSLREYCKVKGIDAKDFVAWIRLHKKSK